MKENRQYASLWQRFFAVVMTVVMLLGMFPGTTIAWAAPEDEIVTTVADPDTVSRPVDVYGNNTENAGKITVGKSVSDTSVLLSYGGNTATITPEKNNFIVTVSQTSQVLGLSSESSVPVDVVFVLDTSGSMDDNDRAETLVTAANSAIRTLMASNEQNRVAVVAFSSETYGGGTSNNAAANVLSYLAHYTGTAATNHLQWVNSSGNASGSERNYIAGRSTVRVGNYNGLAYRHGKNGGTNIQAGIVEGAKLLTSVTDTTYTDPKTNQTVTRIPFLIILSDGQPTYSFDDEAWYTPTTTGDNAADEQGPGSGAYEGNGFIAALTAAYYKGLITEHYYGTKASAEDHCYVYTMGVEIDSLTGDNKRLAQITLDPKSQTTGTYAVDGAASYWNYGNTADSDNNKIAHYGWKAYWNNYMADPAADFEVRVNGSNSGEWIWVGSGEPQEYYVVQQPERPRWNANQATWNKYYEDLEKYNAWVEWRDANFVQLTGQMYTFTDDSINASRKYVTGIGYNGGIAYNDRYFNASSVSEMEAIFQALLRTIQEQALSVPTHVDTAFGEDFSGYVTFTDPIGEYMEVKDMKGVLINGKWYQGKSFAYHMANWSSAPQDFKDTFTNALTERCRLTGATIDVDAFVAQAIASANQAYYHSDSNYDNSIVWWGHSFIAEGEEDRQMQLLGFADNDSIDYIEAQKAAGAIPEGADYVCRSYFYYGTTGDTSATPDNEYLYFMVRVQRSLKAPYQETVVISAPASLLSMEKVVVTETKNNDGTVTYSAKVTPAEPARVVYEVGLRSDINPYNVEEVMAADTAYLAETAQIGGNTVSTNYDAATGTYTFYTNDWNRSEPETSHHRAMTHATFEAAKDNSFYTYQKDTLIYVKSGDSYVPYSGATKPSGAGYYYERIVYDWDGQSLKADGTYDAVKRTVYIPITIPDATSVLIQSGSNWLIKEGTYKASSLTGGEDVYKSENKTQTSVVVSHPHRTVSETNSHYTVNLGNNGKLTMTAVKTKRVQIEKADSTIITDGDGKVVMVGDILTYTVDVANYADTTADATVTDKVPQGTTYVEGSATNGGVYDPATGIVTWNLANIPAGETVTVSFKVLVTVAALSGELGVPSIDNTARVQLTNGFSYTTNTTTNPPEGKKVVDTDGNLIAGNVQVPDVLVYRIRYHNDAAGIATVTVRDIIPAGTSYVQESASHNGVYDAENRTITWTLEGVRPGASGVVSFRVSVNASAVEHIENDASIQIGNNNPRQTNDTSALVAKGDLVLGKIVLADRFPAARNQEFQLHLQEVGRSMNGVYAMTRNGAAVDGGITFVKGAATVTIKSGDEIRISGIPAGSVISVTEAPKAAFTPTYYVNGVPSANEGRAVITEGTEAVSVYVHNSYAPAAVTFTLKGVKKLEAASDVADTSFGFTAYGCDANGENIDPSKLLTGEVTVSSTVKEAAITFGTLVFHEPGQHHYLISEVDGGLTGVGYTKQQYLLTVTVLDDGSGTMTASAVLKSRASSADAFGAAEDYTDTGVTFVNTYVPTPTALTLEASKVLTGRVLKAGEFSFVVMQGNTVISTGTNDATGKVTFRPITYTAPGTYNYTIREVNGGLEGVHYSDAAHTVTVTVVDQNGQLVAVPAYPVGGAQFTNTYTPAGVSVTLQGTKVLEGRALTAGEFNFVVEDENGEIVATGTNDATGKILFTAIGYQVADVGTHTYTVREVKPDVAVDPNMYYDPAVFHVTVTVSYNAETGILSVSSPVVTEGSIYFSNIQNPDHVEVRPEGTKTTANAPEGVSFSFSVINVENGNEAGTGVGAANGNINFSVLSFTELGTYQYWIKESNAGNTTNGITYDNTHYLMQVVVTRNATNKLEASVSYYASDVDGSTVLSDYNQPVAEPTFQNEYKAAGYINLTAKKVLTGRDLKAGEFAFKLVRADNGGEIDGVVAADGTITFATMYYSLADLGGASEATITYTMYEVIPEIAKLPGVSYDSNSYVVKVKITNDGKGNIVATLLDSTGAPVEGGNTNVVFNNAYAPVTGTSQTIGAHKTLTGRDLIPGEFSFQLYHITDSGKNLVATASNAADGTVTFPTRNYPANILAGEGTKTFKYEISEVNNNLGGVTYSGKTYYALVTITDDGQGNLTSSLTYYQDAECNQAITSADVIFGNTYKASNTTFTPVAYKTMNRKMYANDFSFVVKSGDTVVSTGTSAAANAYAEAPVTFTPMGYTAPGTFRYTISEVKGNLPGVLYTSEVYYLQVVVTDDGNGNLVPVGTYYTDSTYTTEVDKVTFTNVYTAENVTVQFHGTKVLTGRDMNQGEFSFVVKDSSGKIVATGGNAAAASGVAAPITFSTIGYKHSDLDGAGSVSFVYTISELAGTEGGVVYDSALFYAKVTVTYNAASGKLETDVKYYADAACTQEANVAFTNAYRTAPATLVIPADKTLVNKVLEAGEFTFTLAGQDGSVLQTKTNDANGVVNFDALTFDTVGTYIYTVSEAVSAGKDATRYTLDKPFTVVVTVTDNLDGQLVASAAYYVDYKNDGSDVNLGSVEFINHYTAPGLTLPLNTEIGAKKTVIASEGTTYSPAGFRFGVVDVTGNLISGVDQEGNSVPMIGVSDADGNIAFPNFRFESAGEYHYWIYEIPEDKGGITQDTAIWELHILVRYNRQTGLLYVNDSDVQTYERGRAAAEDKPPVFVNTYEAKPAKLVLSANKILTGRPLKDNEFMFYLMEGEMIAAQGYNDASGNVFFIMNYAKPGVHTYSVVEFVPESGLGGVTYDTQKYASVTVEVKDDGKGQLVAYLGETALEQGDYISTGVTITNNYYAQPTSAVVQAQKVLSGKLLTDGKFNFRLVNNNNPEDVYTATNDAAGFITFNLNYTAAGVYTYTLSEIVGTDEFITYDTTTYTVTVTVTDDLRGQLHAQVSYGPEGAGFPVFRNIHTPGPVKVHLSALKKLTGRDLVAGEFTFIVVDEDENKVAQGTNDAAGNIQFSAFSLSMPGVYTYTMAELRGDDGNITYDGKTYTVTVTVIDDNGDLRAQVSYETGEAPVFKNVHTPTPITVELEASKELTGRDLVAGEFTFQVKDAEGNEVVKAANAADGKVKFPAITYTEAGEFTYTISEVKGENGNITYDAKSYTVTVTVTDTNGVLSAQVAYENGAAPLFKNVHTPSPIKVELEAGKELAGRDLVAGEFTFQVKDAQGNEVVKAENTADGKVKFPAITYTKAGVHSYAISEVKGENGNITYDAKNYTVTVTVTDTNGVLSAKVTYETGDAPVFGNIHTPTPIKVELEALKKLIGRDQVAGEFTFQVKDAEGNEVVKAENDADGKVKFPAITYTKAGVHTYTISEVKGENGNITYDAKSYTVTVTVTDTNGVLSAQVVYENGTAPVFTNIHTPTPIEVELEASKELTGRDLVAGEFDFVVVDEDENKAAEAVNTADGKIKFSTITYTSAGVYTYTVAELKGEDGNITYDAKTYTVTVTVIDTNGVLSAQVAYENAAAPVFKNVHTPTPITVELEASKELTGRDLVAGEFTFLVKDAEGSEVVKAANAADGKIKFPAITYTEAGEFTYTISEVKGENGNITYDAKSYTVTVTVTDTNGVLSAQVAYGNGAAPVFKNVHTPSPIKVELEAGKELAGRDLVAGEFTFQVKDAQGKEVVKAENTADGKVKFPAITYTKAGVHSYTISEVKGNSDTITYDGKTYTVTVTVTDTNGVLSAKVTYETGAAPVFTNTHTPKPVTVELEGTKVMIGRDLVGEDFTFLVVDEAGNKVAQAMNDVNGKIKFPAMTYTEPGAYIYTVYEVKGDEKGMTYDSEEHTVTVTITNTNGVLSAQVEYPADGVVFENTFKPSVTPNTGDAAPIVMMVSLMIAAAAGIVAMLLGKKKFAR